MDDWTIWLGSRYDLVRRQQDAPRHTETAKSINNVETTRIMAPQTTLPLTLSLRARCPNLLSVSDSRTEFPGPNASTYSPSHTESPGQAPNLL